MKSVCAYMQMYYFLTLSNSFGPIGTIKYFEIVLSERKMRLTGNMKIFLTVIKPRLPIQLASVSWRVSFSNGKWVFEAHSGTLGDLFSTACQVSNRCA